MEQKTNYILLLVAIVLVLLAPCEANWTYLGSDTAGIGYDQDSGGNDYIEWEYARGPYNGGTDANCYGAQANAGCYATVDVDISNVDVNTAAYFNTGTGTWAESYYAWLDSPPADSLYLNFGLSIEGYVDARGSVTDLLHYAETHASSTAYSSAWAHLGGGALAYGSTHTMYGSPDSWDVYGLGEAMEVDLWKSQALGGYVCLTWYEIYLESENYELFGVTIYTAKAGLTAYASAQGSVIVLEEGANGANAYADSYSRGYTYTWVGY